MNGTAELLEAAAQGDERACEQMLRDNSGLIWSIVRRYYGRGVEPDDLYQLGCLGFLPMQFQRSPVRSGVFCGMTVQSRSAEASVSRRR